MTDDEMLRKFRREMIGSSVSHMSDDELDAWMDPWRAGARAGVLEAPGFPAWFVHRRNEARSELLAVLRARR